MKQIKWTILTCAILFSISSAFVTRPHALKTQLYYFNGMTYMPAGTLGVTYVCETSSNVCTYTLSGGVYTPFQTASTYTPIQATTPSTKPAPKKDK